MPGYTFDRLMAKNANLANYVGCLNCRLHWHKRSFERHFNVGAPLKTKAKSRPLAIIHPAWASFIDFLAEGAIKQWMKDHAEGARADEPIETVVRTRRPSKKETATAEHETITVDEAVTRYGLSREEIMADFERNRIPFEVVLPAARRRARRLPIDGNRSSP